MRFPIPASHTNWGNHSAHICLSRNEHYASSLAQFGSLYRRLGKFPSYSYPHPHPEPHSPRETWLGGGILSGLAGLVYFWCVSHAMFRACLWKVCTCLSQQHTGLWDVCRRAYRVLFSAGMSVCLFQSLNPDKSRPNMSSNWFHHLTWKYSPLFFNTSSLNKYLTFPYQTLSD